MRATGPSTGDPPWERLLAELATVAAEAGVDASRELAALADRFAAVPDPGTALPADAPPVLGVDAGKGGWVGVLLADGRSRVLAAPGLAALVELARETAPVSVVGVDIPVGLPDAGRRQADVLARRALPGKASSVFTTLTRAAYEATTYAEARAAQVAATGGTSASAQAWALRERILDVDGYVRGGPPARVVEVHPELSFAHLAGGPLVEPKRTPEGQRLRREALRAAGFPLPWLAAGPSYAVDDLLDACAVAWSAARCAVGRAVSFPEVPEVFSDGIPAAIRA
ncbi:DUF429 domain-containing protein [Nocardioides solisilvae]|uniref:DUF429 domain-containing protein n=1 Tax=Nocardioides solisilvae TaxID=1542435 RepID=UPI0013A53A27|nr:DUF429 domain-containing protein [Nocardioides solisilvae]